MSHSLQLDENGNLRHFLTIEGLPREILQRILDTTASMEEMAARPVKKLPLLRGRTVMNLFFETSTRTRNSFELAAKRLSADVINFNASASATSKGETLLDTLRTLEAMDVDMFIIRHSEAGAAHFFATHSAPGVSILNAGDGAHAHPTQAMLDAYTIQQVKGQFENLKVAIVGDILHSRVARSQVHALSTLGVPDIRLIAPKTLLPEDAASLGARIFNDMDEGIRGCDVVMMLRLQNERMTGAHLPGASEFYSLYGLDQRRLEMAAEDCTVMHPGPMNKGVEIAADVAEGPQSVIWQQVHNGVATRMAIMSLILAGQEFAS